MTQPMQFEKEWRLTIFATVEFENSLGAELERKKKK